MALEDEQIDAWMIESCAFPYPPAQRTSTRVSGLNLVADAFDKLLQPRSWKVCSITLKVQPDSCSCGVWLQVARDA